MKAICNRRRPLRRGAIIPLVTCCIMVVLAFVALVVDGGGLRELRRRAQAAADSAALAAADDLFRNYNSNQGRDPGGSAVNRALANAAANGFSNDGTRS